jgi:hypothetical protein
MKNCRDGLVEPGSTMAVGRPFGNVRKTLAKPTEYRRPLEHRK